MKNLLVLTGGSGFIGSNLMEELIKIKKYRILSLDNYSSGKIKNYLKSSRVKYLIEHTKNIKKILKKYK